MKIIYIPIEVKARELINKLFFITENLSDKFVFLLGNKTSINRGTRVLGKGLYFYKSINHHDTEHIKRVKKKGNVYFSIDVEGGALLNDSTMFQSFLKFRSSKINMELVDKVFTWGDFDDKEWKKKYREYKNKIIKSGEPRIDTWRKKVYSKLFKKEINYLKKFSPYFFIPNSFYSSYDYVKKAIEANKKLSNQRTSIPLKQRIQATKNSYKNFLKLSKLIKKLSKDFPNHNIIIKPHPTENISDLKKKFSKEKNSNIIIDNSFDLTSYIAASECVIFNESTAGIQSMVMKKKTVCYKFKNTLSFRNYANSCAPQVEDYKSLIKYLNNKKFIYQQNKYLNRIRKRFHITKKTSSKIIFKSIKNANLRDLNFNKLKLKVTYLNLYFSLKDYVYYFLSEIKRKIFKIQIGYQSHLLKMPGGIKKKEIENVFSNMGLKDKIKIVNFGKDGYLIYKKI